MILSHVFNYSPKCSSQPQGTGTGLSLQSCLEGGCWTALHGTPLGVQWVSIGLDWAALGSSPLRRTSPSLHRYRNQMGTEQKRSRACSSLGRGSELGCERSVRVRWLDTFCKNKVWHN